MQISVRLKPLLKCLKIFFMTYTSKHHEGPSSVLAQRPRYFTNSLQMSLKREVYSPEANPTLLVFINIILTCGVLSLIILLLPSQFSENPGSHRKAVFLKKNCVIPWLKQEKYFLLPGRLGGSGGHSSRTQGGPCTREGGSIWLWKF